MPDAPTTGAAGSSVLDVVVIGGGIHGCAVARELALRGRAVMVLERSVPGAEASSVAGGILGPHLEADAGPLLDIGAYSLGLYPEWARHLQAESGVDVLFEEGGGALVAFDEDEAKRLEVRADRAVGARFLVGDSLRSWEPSLSRSALAALVFANQAQVDPPSVMKALPVAAEVAGVWFEQDTVLRVEGAPGAAWWPGEGLGGATPVSGHSRVTVVGEKRSYSARHVEVAAGAWSTLLPGVGLPSEAVRPARGQIVELKTDSRLLRAVLFSERGYVLSRADGRVLAGSTLEFVGFQKGVTVRGLAAILDIARELVPALADAEVVAMRSGFRPYTADHLPLLGPALLPGLWMLTGHHRNGILLAPGSAALLADLLCGSKPAVDVSALRPGRVLRAKADHSNDS